MKEPVRNDIIGDTQRKDGGMKDAVWHLEAMSFFRLHTNVDDALEPGFHMEAGEKYTKGESVISRFCRDLARCATGFLLSSGWTRPWKRVRGFLLGRKRFSVIWGGGESL